MSGFPFIVNAALAIGNISQMPRNFIEDLDSIPKELFGTPENMMVLLFGIGEATNFEVKNPQEMVNKIQTFTNNMGYLMPI